MQIDQVQEPLNLTLAEDASRWELIDAGHVRDSGNDTCGPAPPPAVADG